MKSMLRIVNDHGKYYQVLLFVCPGCMEFGSSGLHMLPINTNIKQTQWTFNGNLEKPTLNPSILTGKDGVNICHSWLTDGIFNFLEDSTHSLSGQYVLLPDLPDWIVKE